MKGIMQENIVVSFCKMVSLPMHGMQLASQAIRSRDEGERARTQPPAAHAWQERSKTAPALVLCSPPTSSAAHAVWCRLDGKIGARPICQRILELNHYCMQIVGHASHEPA